VLTKTSLHCQVSPRWLQVTAASSSYVQGVHAMCASGMHARCV